RRLRLRHGGTPQPISTSVGGQTACRQCAAAFPSLNDIGGVDDRTVVALEALKRHEMITFDGASTAVRYPGDVIVDEVSVPSRPVDSTQVSVETPASNRLRIPCRLSKSSSSELAKAL